MRDRRTAGALKCVAAIRAAEELQTRIATMAAAVDERAANVEMRAAETHLEDMLGGWTDRLRQSGMDLDLLRCVSAASATGEAEIAQLQIRHDQTVEVFDAAKVEHATASARADLVTALTKRLQRRIRRAAEESALAAIEERLLLRRAHHD